LKRFIRINNSTGTAAGPEQFELFRLLLSTRARNLLKRLEIRTLGELREYGLERLEGEKGCGRKTCNEIRAEIEKLELVGPEKYVAASRAGGDNLDKPGINMDTGTALQLLVDELGKAGFINSTQAQKLLGKDSAEVRHLLNLLVDKGFAAREGRRRGMRYVRVV
jgi:hypothetical protein